MEDALTPPAPPVPLAASAAAASTTLFLTRRRSHLDSASYRTLSRLFSHFLHPHPSPAEPPSHQEVEPAAPNPICDSGEYPKAGSPPKDAEFNPGKDVEEEPAAGSTSDLEIPAPAGVEAAETNPIANLRVAPQESPGREVAGVERVESLEDIVVAGITRGKTSACFEELGGGPGLVGENEAFRSMKACLEGEAEESIEVAVCNDVEHLLLDAMMTNFSGLIDEANGGTMPMQNCGVSRGEPQNDDKVAEGVKELGCRIEEDRPVSNSDCALVDSDEFEEGEIEGDMQALEADESGVSEFEDKHADDRKLEGDCVTRESGENESSGRDIRCLNLLSTHKIKGKVDLVLNKEGNVKDDTHMHVPRAQAVSYDEVVEWNETPLHDAEAPRPGKRKRHLTEERKAKKTKNKRIKRAQQREADGVKRLKLAPIKKPKVVKYCHFYLHGKCQQGNVCKFSHDTTPLTKSKPCTHFARGSCLKGDDCPYDHELSKYPCHNFLENGMCARRDKCKFSHVVPTADGPSPQDTNKSDALLVSEKAIHREQTSSHKRSTLLDSEPVTSAPTKHYSILKNLSGISLNSQKVSARIPKGVKFLPFSKDRPDSSILHQDALSTENHRYTNGSQNQIVGGPQAAKGDTNAKPNRQKSALLFDEKNSSKAATSHPCSEPKKTSLPIDSTAVPGLVSIQYEVSEASRILQEFLFGTGS